MNDFELEDMLIRSLQGRISAEEVDLLARWRAQSPENEARYERMSATWRITTGHEATDRSLPPTPEQIIRAALRDGQREARVQRQDDSHSRSVRIAREAPSHSTKRSIAAAAIVVLALGLGYIASMWWGGSEPNAAAISPAAYSEVSTGEGERTTITLLDGTAVRLGPHSTLRVTNEGDSPVVWLEGRAYFGVHPDPTRTFTVQTLHGEAVALGTRFEVRTENEEFQVFVLQGDVRILSGGAAYEIGEGIMTRSVLGGPPSTFRVDDVYELLDWMGPVLVFRETPLAQAVSEISHRYGAQLELADPRLADRPITGTFAYRPLDEVVSVVCEIVGAECVEEGGAFRIGAPNAAAAHSYPNAGAPGSSLSAGAPGSSRSSSFRSADSFRSAGSARAADSFHSAGSARPAGRVHSMDSLHSMDSAHSEIAVRSMEGRW